MSNLFIYNSHSMDTPVGTVASYLGTTDPDGWVICDGQARTVSDGRFVNIFGRLNTMLGVTTNTANSIKPPDLRSKFIYGASTITATPTTGGKATVTLITDNMPSHNHTASDSGHTHQLSGGATQIFGGGLVAPASSTGGSKVGYGSTTSSNAIITIGNTGGGTAFDILPPYYTLNYILKY